MRTATNVRTTSVDAYYAMVGTRRRNTQHAQIMLALAGKRAGLTRAELATATGLPINVVCPRVVELRKLGTIEELPQRPNASGFGAHPLRIVPPQSVLFPEAA